MRVAAQVMLTAIERRRLETWASARSTTVRLVERSKIVLMACAGMPNQAIAKALGIDQNTVGRWRNRFVKERVKGIEKERPRGGNHGGKDSKRQAKLRARIIEATTQTTPKDATHWSTRTMARAMGTTHSVVHRVWQSHGLKPHLIRTFKVSNDPRFEEKLHDVVGLYLNPPENAVVFSVDEKSSVQALDRTQPGLPIKKGRYGTMTHDYKRHGTTTLFAALDVATGAVIGESYRRHRHQEVLRFLKKVEKAVPKEQELHIILDNYATHKHEEVLRWIERGKRIFLHFIPTSSSWLNMVERFFRTLTDRQIRRGVFTSVKELEARLAEYIDTYNENPQPFVWTKSAKQILEKVGRARQTLGHHSASLVSGFRAGVSILLTCTILGIVA